MARRSHLTPASFELRGGPIGVLLIHGFTGAPNEMRLLGEDLHRRGMSVLAPLLPGHGTSVDDMNRTRWQEWTACVAGALAGLRARCPVVFAGGLSMGSLLALYLAEHEPDLAGVMAYSPALHVADRRLALSPLVKHVKSTLPKGPTADQDLTSPDAAQHLWSYEDTPIAAAAELFKLRRSVERLLPRVHCPLLVVHSTRDPAIRRDSAAAVYARVGTPPAAKTMLTLHDSGHNMLVDSEWRAIAEQTAAFIFRHIP